MKFCYTVKKMVYEVLSVQQEQELSNPSSFWKKLIKKGVLSNFYAIFLKFN